MPGRDQRSRLPFPGPPIYHQIVHTLESRIYHGMYQPGTTIPSETVLAREFGVTRLTVRQALQQLTDQGIIEPRRGSGTYVADNPKVPRPVNFQGFLEDGALQRLSMETALVQTKVVPAPDDVAVRLQLAPSTPVLFVERVRSVKGTPATRTANYMSEALGQLLPLAELAHWSMSDLLREYAHLPPLSGHQTLTAEGAPPEVAARLNVQVGTPLLRSDFELRDGQTPCTYVMVHHRPEFNFYTATLISLGPITPPATHSPGRRPAAPRPRPAARGGAPWTSPRRARRTNPAS